MAGADYRDRRVEGHGQRPLRIEKRQAPTPASYDFGAPDPRQGQPVLTATRHAPRNNTHTHDPAYDPAFAPHVASAQGSVDMAKPRVQPPSRPSQPHFQPLPDWDRHDDEARPAFGAQDSYEAATPWDHDAFDDEADAPLGTPDFAPPPQGTRPMHSPRAYAQAEAQSYYAQQYGAQSPRAAHRLPKEAALGDTLGGAARGERLGTASFQVAEAKPALGRMQKMVNLLGAAGSVVLVASLGWWGWELALRDVNGVPIVRAMEGAMRIKPDNAGGAVVSHQGLAVNDVAARDGRAAGDRITLAPNTINLNDDDIAGLSELTPVIEPQAGSEAISDTSLDTELAAAEPAPEPIITQEDAVALALAEALGIAPEDAGLEAQATGEDATVGRSMRPRARPAHPDQLLPQDLAYVAASAPQASEIPESQLAIGTRLVQFGAFDSPELARADWQRISHKLGSLMSGKAMVLQSAVSGGQTFWRLRGHGFENEDDARRFCSAAIGDGVNCIPVSHR